MTNYYVGLMFVGLLLILIGVFSKKHPPTKGK